MLGPGEYRTGALKLPTGTQIIGVRGATRLVFTGGHFDDLRARRRSHHAVRPRLRRQRQAAARGGAIVHIAGRKNFRMIDCEMRRSSRNGIALEAVEGAVTGNHVTGAAEAAIFSRDAHGLTIQNNIIREAGNNGIQVWRQQGR